MADTLHTTHTSGATVYAMIFNAAGQVADVVAQAFEAYDTASIANYDLAMTEQGTASRHYLAAFPAWIPAGMYRVTYYDQTGGAPAETDAIVAEEVVHWHGAAFVSLGNVWAALHGDTLWDYAAGELKFYDGNGYQGGAGTVVRTMTLSAPGTNKTLQSGT